MPRSVGAVTPGALFHPELMTRMRVHQAECTELVAWMQSHREPFAGFARSLEPFVKAAVSLTRSLTPGLSAAWHADKADEILDEADRRLAWERARN